MLNKALNSDLEILNGLDVNRELLSVFYYHYKNDINFPRSCGSISVVMTVILQNSSAKELYDIFYVRGNYKNDLYIEDDACEEVVECDYNRESNLSSFDCIGCGGCDYMLGHSWIELVDKKTKKTIILDLTSIQLEEDFGDYETDIMNSEFDKNELFDYMLERSKFIVLESDSRFNNYIRSEEVCTGRDILVLIKEIIADGDESELTVLLDNIGYSI